MRMQDSAANCGPTALHNALLAIGVVRSVQELEVLCGTSATNGTPVRSLKRALSKIEGVLPVEIKERRRDIAALKLRHSLTGGRPVVLLWTSLVPGDHWVTAVGLLGDRYLICDPGDLELVTSVEIDSVCSKWECDGSYYGVVL